MDAKVIPELGRRTIHTKQLKLCNSFTYYVDYTDMVTLFLTLNSYFMESTPN